MSPRRVKRSRSARCSASSRAERAAPVGGPTQALAAKAAPASGPSTAMPPAPAAAKMAAEDKIDLASIVGSGKRGQVLKGDVIAAAAARAPRARRRACPIATARARSRARGADDHAR